MGNSDKNVHTHIQRHHQSDYGKAIYELNESGIGKEYSGGYKLPPQFCRLKCQVCNKKFPDKDLLDNHQELEHINFWVKKHAEKSKKVSEKREKIKGEFQCEFCEKTFEYQKTLKAHMFSHTGNWPYSCDICGKGVSSKYNLDRHRLQVHTKEYKFKCEVCGN